MASEAQRRASTKYNKAHTDLISVRVQKGVKERWLAFAESKGESLSRCLINSIEERIARETATYTVRANVRDGRRFTLADWAVIDTLSDEMTVEDYVLSIIGSDDVMSGTPSGMEYCLEIRDAEGSLVSSAEFVIPSKGDKVEIDEVSYTVVDVGDDATITDGKSQFSIPVTTAAFYRE